MKFKIELKDKPPCGLIETKYVSDLLFDQNEIDGFISTSNAQAARIFDLRNPEDLLIIEAVFRIALNHDFDPRDQHYIGVCVVTTS